MKRPCSFVCLGVVLTARAVVGNNTGTGFRSAFVPGPSSHAATRLGNGRTNEVSAPRRQASFPTPPRPVRSTTLSSATRENGDTSLADLLASWFKLPNTSASAADAKRNRKDQATREMRASIDELRSANADLRSEVVSLRAFMEQKGVIPVEDFFAKPYPKKESPITTANSAEQLLPATREPASNTPPPTPPPPLRREARLAALALLWAAALSAGGVFVPIAIGEGAADAWRWLDGGGSVPIPNGIRRIFREGMGRWLSEKWRRGRMRDRDVAALSFVPVRARAHTAEEQCREDDDFRLAAAWTELDIRQSTTRRPSS